jgi:hypothetical protein
VTLSGATEEPAAIAVVVVAATMASESAAGLDAARRSGAGARFAEREAAWRPLRAARRPLGAAGPALGAAWRAE